MDQFLASLPKPVIAIAVIFIGFMLLRVYDPPRTICDMQMEIFRESQASFLYRKNPKGIGKPSLAKQYFDLCKTEGSPGGCFEFFEGMKKFAADLRNIPATCSETAAAEPEIQQWLNPSMKLMAQIAWGERAPASVTVKHGWFDASELVLFCDLRRNAIKVYGDHAYSEWREVVLQGLPQADQLTRERLWQNSLLSTPCDAYR